LWENQDGVNAMTIEIRRPELEALLLERMRRGGFSSVEDVLLEALNASSSTLQDSGQRVVREATGADLVATMQASPYREISLEPSREEMPVRK